MLLSTHSPRKSRRALHTPITLHPLEPRHLLSTLNFGGPIVVWPAIYKSFTSPNTPPGVSSKPQFHFTPSDFAVLGDSPFTISDSRDFRLNGQPVHYQQTITHADIPNLTYSPSTGGSAVFQLLPPIGQGFYGAQLFIFTETPPTLHSAQLLALPNHTLLISPNTSPPAPLTIDPLFSDSDGDTPHWAKITRLPTHGTLALNNTPIHAGQILSPDQFSHLTYAAKNFTGADALSLTLSDGHRFTSGDISLPILASTAGNPLLTANGGLPRNNQPASSAATTDFGIWSASNDPALPPDTRTYYLYNTSAANLTLSLPTFVGTHAGFSLFNAPSNRTVAPADKLPITVRFQPTAAGKQHATLAFPSGDLKHPFLLQLAGTGLATRTIHTNLPTPGAAIHVATTHAGTGAGATNGQILTITFKAYDSLGRLIDSSARSNHNGITFRLDNNYPADQPFFRNAPSDPVGNTFIAAYPGLHYALQGIKRGESRTLWMNAAADSLLSPDTAARFEVQCLSFLDKPQLNVYSLRNFTPLNSGATTTSADNGTRLTLHSGSNSTYTNFDFSILFTDNANGTLRTNLAVSSFTLTGPNAADFSIGPATGYFSVIFHPATTSPVLRNATVHIHFNDPLTPDFTFAVRGKLL